MQFAAAVTVPPGYTTYYISGAVQPWPIPMHPWEARSGYGDTETQTASALARLKATMAKLGLTFGDIVQAHVFLVGDPAMAARWISPA